MVRESLLIVGVAITGVAAMSGDQRALERGRATFADGTTVTLEIADSEAERQRGLMHRESLAEDAGMLFVFEKPGFYPFWMQNCRIALDIVWLDETFKVVSIAESVPPCRLPGCEPPCASPQCPTYAPAEGTRARYVVELAAGFATRHGLKTSQRLAIALPPR